ncbi:unnamed protein product [Prorocentrum cordatum]|uniref:RNA helicase n=1 Tax=Prorocentrum cordatum TaxID=2364126 RepID=A0ABN9PT24_9DINO|nr:unnamed protein product [Polarella glacialis]
MECEAAGGSGVHSADCQQMPVHGRQPGAPRPGGPGVALGSFALKLRGLLATKGPLGLAAVPGAWDAEFGAGCWVAERPVRQVHKACSPPYGDGTEVVDGSVHLVEELPDQGPTTEARAAAAEVAALPDGTRELVAMEFSACARGRQVGVAFARAADYWQCRLELPREVPTEDGLGAAARSASRDGEAPAAPGSASASQEAVKAVGFGEASEDALLAARARLLELLGRWGGAGDPRLARLLDGRRALRRVLAALEEFLPRRGAHEGPSALQGEEVEAAPAAPEAGPAQVLQLIDELLAHLCALLREPPPCRAACWALVASSWPHLLWTQDHGRLHSFVATMWGSPLRMPFRTWSRMAEHATWHVRFPALELLEGAPLADEGTAAGYAAHHLYSLLLEQRAQLLQECDRGSASCGVAARWEPREEGWSCSIDAGALASLPGGGRGIALLVTSPLSAAGDGAVCELTDDGRALARGVPGLAALVSLLCSPTASVTALQCHATVHARQVEALRAVIAEHGSPFDAAMRRLLVTSWRPEPDSGSLTAAAELGSGRPGGDTGLPEDARDGGTEDAARLSTLTSAQREAVQNALSRRLSLVRGPPGTGKTQVAAAIVARAVARLEAGSRVLAVTQSNAAARNLHRRLEMFGVRAARVGMALQATEVTEQELFAAVRDNDRQDADVELMQRASEVEGRPQALADGDQRDDAQSPRGTSTVASIRWSEVASRIGVTPGALNTALFTVMQRLARRADAVVMTCATSGNKGLLRCLGPLPLLVLDEAAQCVEPALLVPLSLGCRALAAVGDEKQLPATVLDRVAADRGLGCSFFERCVSDGLVGPSGGFVQLDEQRRMHPSIAEFPSRCFYDGGVLDAMAVTEVGSRPPPPGFPWPSAACQVCFVDCDGRGHAEDAGRSRANSYEAETLVRVLKGFLAAGTAAADIAVIAGYSAQRALLQSLVSRRLGSQAQGLKVGTVDGFQGAERDLVLVSTVRSNAGREVGFLRDRRRVNVAPILTRARRGLVVFGSASTLEGEALTWRPWLDWARGRGAVLSAAAALPQPTAAAPATAAPAAPVVPKAGSQAEDCEPGWTLLREEVRLLDEELAQERAQDEELEAPAPREPSDAGGWTQYVDPVSGRQWMWNEATKDAVWL